MVTLTLNVGNIVMFLFIIIMASIVIWLVNAGAFKMGEVQNVEHESAARLFKWISVAILGVTAYCFLPFCSTAQRDT